MYRITIVKDPANISDHEVNYVQSGVNLLDWLIGRYGPDGFEIPTTIFEGFISAQTQLDIDADLNKEITSDIYIIHRPLGFDPATYFVIALVVSLAVTALIPTPELPAGERQDTKSSNNKLSGQTNVARPLERVPDIFGTVKSFPDLITPTTFEYINNIQFATEYMCVSRGLVDISEVKSGDTLVENILGSSVQIFEPNQSPTQVLRTQTSNEVKSLTLNPPNDAGVKLTADFILKYDSVSDTGTILGPSADKFEDYDVGSVVTLDDVFIKDAATEQTLDEEYIVSSIHEIKQSLSPTQTTYNASTDRGTISGKNFSSFIVGEEVYIEGARFITADLDTRIDGKYIVYAAGNNDLILSDVSTVSDQWLTPEAEEGIARKDAIAYQSKIELGNVSGKSQNWALITSPKPPLQVLTITDNRVLDPRSRLPDEVQVRGPFVAAGDRLDEIWLDFTFPRGLVDDGNKNVTVDVTVLLEEIDSSNNPVGPSFTVDYSFTENSQDVFNFTRKITSEDGLDNTKRYRVSCERTSNTKPSDTNLLDQIQWSRLASIRDITETDTTNTTRVQIKTQATEQAASLQNREFNMIATRRVVSYVDGSVVGNIETGEGLVASSRMADIFLHYCLDPKLAARDISQVDANAIYAIQNELDSLFDGELGEFNYTFDNQNTPAIEELRQIANAARCFVFREGSVISMVRDQRQDVSRALFNRRNKKPDSEFKTVRFNKPLDNDGVQIEFQDREQGYKTFTYTLPDDLDSSDPNYGLPTTKNPKKIEATGVTSKQQAWNRAQYELNRLIHQRISVETGVTEEAILLPLNARIDHVDGTTLARAYSRGHQYELSYEESRPAARLQSNGEIEGFNGLTCTTSERCIFEVGKTYSVILRDDNGEPSTPIAVTARSDTEFGFVLSESPNFDLFVRGDNGYQVGALYNFAPDGDELANQYLVQKKTPDQDGNVTLELINYTDKYYQADDQAPPQGRAFSAGFNTGFE